MKINYGPGINQIGQQLSNIGSTFMQVGINKAAENKQILENKYSSDARMAQLRMERFATEWMNNEENLSPENGVEDVPARFEEAFNAYYDDNKSKFFNYAEHAERFQTDGVDYMSAELGLKVQDAAKAAYTKQAVTQADNVINEILSDPNIDPAKAKAVVAEQVNQVDRIAGVEDKEGTLAGYYKTIDARTINNSLGTVLQYGEDAALDFISALETGGLPRNFSLTRAADRVAVGKELSRISPSLSSALSAEDAATLREAVQEQTDERDKALLGQYEDMVIAAKISGSPIDIEAMDAGLQGMAARNATPMLKQILSAEAHNEDLTDERISVARDALDYDITTAFTNGQRINTDAIKDFIETVPAGSKSQFADLLQTAEENNTKLEEQAEEALLARTERAFAQAKIEGVGVDLKLFDAAFQNVSDEIYLDYATARSSIVTYNGGLADEYYGEQLDAGYIVPLEALNEIESASIRRSLTQRSLLNVGSAAYAESGNRNDALAAMAAFGASEGDLKRAVLDLDTRLAEDDGFTAESVASVLNSYRGLLSGSYDATEEATPDPSKSGKWRKLWQQEIDNGDVDPPEAGPRSITAGMSDPEIVDAIMANTLMGYETSPEDVAKLGEPYRAEVTELTGQISRGETFISDPEAVSALLKMSRDVNMSIEAQESLAAAYFKAGQITAKDYAKLSKKEVSESANYDVLNTYIGELAAQLDADFDKTIQNEVYHWAAMQVVADPTLISSDTDNGGRFEDFKLQINNLLLDKTAEKIMKDMGYTYRLIDGKSVDLSTKGFAKVFMDAKAGNLDYALDFSVIDTVSLMAKETPGEVQDAFSQALFSRDYADLGYGYQKAIVDINSTFLIGAEEYLGAYKSTFGLEGKMYLDTANKTWVFSHPDHDGIFLAPGTFDPEQEGGADGLKWYVFKAEKTDQGDWNFSDRIGEEYLGVYADTALNEDLMKNLKRREIIAAGPATTYTGPYAGYVGKYRSTLVKDEGTGLAGRTVKYKNGEYVHEDYGMPAGPPTPEDTLEFLDAKISYTEGVYALLDRIIARIERNN